MIDIDTQMRANAACDWLDSVLPEPPAIISSTALGAALVERGMNMIRAKHGATGVLRALSGFLEAEAYIQEKR
jgi:hypothetical protein